MFWFLLCAGWALFVLIGGDIVRLYLKQKVKDDE
jgi:hypothetical protein